MAKYKTEDLLNGLQRDVERIKEAAEFFQSADKSKLAYSPGKGKWSVVQVLEHLNAYNRHYLPVMEKELSYISHKSNIVFTSGFFGEKFTKMIRPANVYEVKNKMKAPKAYSFPNSLNVDAVMKEFVAHQDKFLRIIELARNNDINAIKIPITLTSLIKLKLGDMLRFLMAHQQRHMIQARNTMREVGVVTDKFPVILQAAVQ